MSQSSDLADKPVAMDSINKVLNAPTKAAEGFKWLGYEYDLLPQIFQCYDKHMQIHILRLMTDEYEKLEFNPYKKESLLVQLCSLLEKTCRYQEYNYYICQRYGCEAQEDGSITGPEEFVPIVKEKLQKMQDKCQEAIDFCEDQKSVILQIYYSQDDEMPITRSPQIKRILKEWEQDGEQMISVEYFNEVVATKRKSDIINALLLFDMREHLQELYNFGRKLYELAEFKNAEVLLQKYVNLATGFMETSQGENEEQSEFNKMHKKRVEQAHWGIICCRLLEGDYSQDAVDALLSYWNTPSTEPRNLSWSAKQQSWLLHWLLFQNLLNERERQGLNDLLEIFHQEGNKTTIITVAPWLLRYYTFAAVCSKRNLGTKIVECNDIAHKILAGEVNTFKDPMTEFLRCLFVDCDFEGASQKLNECRQLFTTDVFLCLSCVQFFNQARLLFFSRYCIVNMMMDIDKIGQMLMLGQWQDQPDNELWSVGGQPVHYEPQNLTQWVTHTVRALQKEQIRQATEGEDDIRPQYTMRIDLRNNMLITKPTYDNEFSQLLQSTKTEYFNAKKFAEQLR